MLNLKTLTYTLYAKFIYTFTVKMKLVIATEKPELLAQSCKSARAFRVGFEPDPDLRLTKCRA